jgi:ATP-dependent Clp protease ATP-binding subunit ClpB
MRLDKFTTTFQSALSDAQSMANGRDNPYVEPVHLLLAMLMQTDGPKALLSRAGVNAAKLQAALEAELQKLPQVQGGEQVQTSRDLGSPLQARAGSSGCASTCTQAMCSFATPGR